MVSVLGIGYLDDLVKASSEAIRDLLGRKRNLYQVSAGSFLVVLEGAEAQDWRGLVSRLSDRLKEPILCNEIPVAVHAVIGVAPFQLGESSPENALRTAVSAAHEARQAEVSHAVYSPIRDDANRRRFTILTDIQDALNQSDQFRLVYQPRVDGATGKCLSAEALLRWRNPNLGNVSPGEFIPLVEQTALGRPVTQWVVESVLAQIADWRRKGLELRISINVSALNLEEQDFAQRLAANLERYSVPASAIELEFTESALIRNGSRVMSQLHELRAMKVDLAIDDFGTGYSTFSYLQRIPASTVKLDQSFMQTLRDSSRNRMLVRSMITMAHELGYRVVAEGVETEEALTFLVECGCEEIQGYWIARPLTRDAFEAWFRDNADISMRRERECAAVEAV